MADGDGHVTDGGLPVLRFPAKMIRAAVIESYMREAGLWRAVCFTCGNASTALEAFGVQVEAVVNPSRWWTPGEIARQWPGRFDATSGHLPLHLMLRVGGSFRRHLGNLGDLATHWAVPTGSGETILCLRWAYPSLRFFPVQDGTPATIWHPEAPLRALVHGLVLGHPKCDVCDGSGWVDAGRCLACHGDGKACVACDGPHAVDAPRYAVPIGAWPVGSPQPAAALLIKDHVPVHPAWAPTDECWHMTPCRQPDSRHAHKVQQR